MARTTWYASLLGILRSNPRLAANGEISVVTFNYDRSLEHFLHVAVTASSPPEVPSEILRVLRPDSFLHIHGKIGLLPWESEVGRRYSHDISPDEILQSAQMIRLPHESPEINSRIEAIIQNAQVVMFLGFGFHPTNLRKICFERLRDFGVVRGFATMIEIPPDRMGEITRFFPMEIVTTKISDCVEKLKLISRAENGMRQ